MLPTIVCIAKTRQDAEQIVARLDSGNVNLSDVSLLFNPPGRDDPATTAASAKTGTQAGVGAGAAVGAAAAAATLAVPGLQPLLVTAPLVSLAGAILGALFGAGGLLAQLAGLGIMESRQDYYRQKIDEGGYLIAVQTEDEAALTRALRIFEEAHARDIELFRLTKKLT
jgi:hypothetical protein